MAEIREVMPHPNADRLVLCDLYDGKDEHIALTGANGSGKSSLFALLTGELSADQGSIDGLDGIRVAAMAQEVEPTPVPALEFIIGGDSEVVRATSKQGQRDASEIALVSGFATLGLPVSEDNLVNADVAPVTGILIDNL